MTSYNPNCLPKAPPPDTIRRQSFKIWLLGNTNIQCTAGRETVKKNQVTSGVPQRHLRTQGNLKFPGTLLTLDFTWPWVATLPFPRYFIRLSSICDKPSTLAFWISLQNSWFSNKFSLTSSFCRRQRVVIALILSSICMSTRFSRHQTDLFGGEDAPHKMHFYSENIILMDWLKSRIQTFSSKL